MNFLKRGLGSFILVAGLLVVVSHAEAKKSSIQDQEVLNLEDDKGVQEQKKEPKGRASKEQKQEKFAAKKELDSISREGLAPVILSKDEKESVEKEDVSVAKGVVAKGESKEEVDVSAEQDAEVTKEDANTVVATSEEAGPVKASEVETSSDDKLKALSNTESKSLATEKSEGVLPPLSQASSLPWLRTLVSFIFVTSLIFVVGYLLKNRSRFSKLTTPSDLPLRLLQTLPLGMKKNLLVVDFEGQKLLLSSIGQQIQLLYPQQAHVALPQAGYEQVREERATSQSQVNHREIASRLEEAEASAIKDKVEISDQIRKVVRGLKPMDRKPVH